MGKQAIRNSKFVAVDGEAINDKYVLLCASDGKYVYREDELSTSDIFQYLLRLKKRHGKKVYVTFGLNYDVNMMLRDLPKSKLTELWENGHAWVSIDGFSYSLNWIPRKMFDVRSPDLKQSIRLYDVFGFFQSSFVKALDAWKIDDPHGEIKRMKSERARFDVSQKDDIREYCLSECEKLVELCEALDESLLGANIKLRSYMGAGSVAGAILSKEGVKKHRVSDSAFPLHVQEAVYRSYFGGRIELFMQGSFVGLTNYDIRSAYPFQCLSLPSLEGGAWRNARLDEVTTPGLHAIWRVKWDVKKQRVVMPFPLRRKEAIFYPQNGEGYYHHAEVRAAIEMFGNEVVPLSGLVFEPCTEEKPFSFVRKYYEERARLKAEGNAAEKAYKLGLNSLYGKLAQGMSQNGEPPYRSLFWAGRITSGTRARLLDAASLAPERVISMATDGIVFSGDPGIEESNVLGGWERSEFSAFFVAQPGIYKATADDGKTIKKSRGFFTREIDYDDLEKGWLEYGPGYTQRAVCNCGHLHTGECHECDCQEFERRRRFVGLGTALHRTDFGVWRTWQESDRILSLSSSRKFYASENVTRTMRLLPPRFPSSILSEPYVPKAKTLEDKMEMAELIAQFEQPLLMEE